MFGLFGKKKTEVEKLIDQDGIDHATRRFAEVISKKLPTKEIAYQFILEEIEAASQGNNAARSFADASGISGSEYKGAMSNSTQEIDGPEGPQQLLLHLCSQLNSNTDLMVEFRVRIADNIMKKFYLGRYTKDLPVGISKYENLKHILKNEKILDAIIMSASGINQAPIDIAFEVNDAIKIVNYISNLIGVPGLELVNAISAGQHDEQIRSLIVEAERQKDYEYVSDGDDWAEELISWAEQNDLPMLSSFDSPAYRKTGFPRSKAELKGLEYLHLPSCNISELPASIGNLKNIQAICLDGNQISEIPKEVCSISSLVRLDLDDNQITTLPKEIGQLKNLQTLSLRNNPIKDFPIEMKGLQNLRTLDLKGVKIHLSSKYSPLSSDGFEVYQYFNYTKDIVREDNLSYWLKNTDTSNLEITG